VDPGSPAATPLSALGTAGGVGFLALEAARARTAERCDAARAALAGMPRDPDVAVVLLGSWGRGELTSGSDDDVLVVTTGVRRPGLRPRVAELQPAFAGASGAQGTFDDVVTVEELATIGLQEDSNRVLTRRMLVLLESAPLLGPDVHRRVLARLLDAYLGGERRDRRPPRFLLNDVIRYWRTVAVDFEAKARAGDDGKWALRHAKLRTSRTMLFAGGLLPLLECHHVTADDAPALLLEQLLQPPTDRIAAAFLQYDAVDAGVRTLGAYDRFLDLLDDPERRAVLEGLSRADAREDPVFQECRRLGREIQQGLAALLFEREPLRRLVRQYGVF
jgi:hypothetical protein